MSMRIEMKSAALINVSCTALISLARVSRPGSTCLLAGYLICLLIAAAPPGAPASNQFLFEPKGCWMIDVDRRADSRPGV